MKKEEAIEQQESKTWNLDDAREDFIFDVYDTLDWLPTHNEANRIIDSFDKVTSGIKCDVLDKMKTEIEGMYRVILKGTPKNYWVVRWNDCIDEVLQIIDKYKAEER